MDKNEAAKYTIDLNNMPDVPAWNRWFQNGVAYGYTLGLLRSRMGACGIKPDDKNELYAARNLIRRIEFLLYPPVSPNILSVIEAFEAIKKHNDFVKCECR